MSEAEAQVKLTDFKSIFSLEGKVAVVTGGSRGLGLHVASGYALNWELHQFLLSYRNQILTESGFSSLAAPRSTSHPEKRTPANRHAPL